MSCFLIFLMSSIDFIEMFVGVARLLQRICRHSRNFRWLQGLIPYNKPASDCHLATPTVKKDACALELDLLFQPG